MIRLNKLLADAGLASRREAERLLAAGRVTVNGCVVIEPGAAADPERDTVTLDGQIVSLARVRAGDHRLYIALHKPVGYVTTARDPQGRPTVFSLVDRPERLFAVGRLDMDTDGLLLLTNDGTWANRIAHPSAGIEKEYHALVDGVPMAARLRQFEEGIVLPDGFVAHGTGRVVERLGPRSWVALILHEGHKRQARLMLAAIGTPVRHLTRVRIGPLRLGTLSLGEWRDLTPDEVAAVVRRSPVNG